VRIEKKRTMNNRIVQLEERQFITREFADALAGKQPHPYLRLHDVVQQELIGKAKGPYLDRMIHFWREVSLAGMRRDGPGMDECYALLFESVFDLAEAEPEWAGQIFAETEKSNHKFTALKQLNHQLCYPISHQGLVDAFRRCYAPLREQDRSYDNAVYVALYGEFWFWAAITCAVGIDEKHVGWSFLCEVTQCSVTGWGDDRPHVRLIREAPRHTTVTPRDQLMAHPILRLARLKYRDGSIEQGQVLRFLNAQCIKQGFESEEDYFGSDLALAQWARDARQWATNMLEIEPEVCEELFEEVGEAALDRTGMFYREHLGSSPAQLDSLDATTALIKWAQRRRGFEFSQYRAQLWEFVVEIADAALWLGWLFPSSEAL
jgi:hypothetical protein